MQIHVARHSSQLGVFTAEEIIAGLAAGRFLASDLAWREGMANWTPLSEWPEFRGAVPPAMPGAPTVSPASGPMPAWERGATVGNFFATIRDVALDPVRTFDALPAGGYAKPISYAYANLVPVWLLMTMLFGFLSLFMWGSIQHELRQDPNMPAFIVNLSPALFFFATSAFVGVFVALAPWISFISAAVVHVLLLPWGPQGGFAQTYRASSYATSAFTLPSLIPCVNYIVGVWQLVALVIAAARVHKIAWWKVLISLLIIPLTCCCLFAGLIPVLSRLPVR